MPDSFFASTKTRKRKRSVNTIERPGSAKKIIRKGKASSQDASHAGIRRGVKRTADEELNSDRTDSEAGGIDDIDLRASIDPETSGDEDEDETPAEKRLRLAKLYLDGVKDGLGKYSPTEFVFQVFTMFFGQPRENLMLPRLTES
jgi:ribosomal RNA-processing protein 9